MCWNYLVDSLMNPQRYLRTIFQFIHEFDLWNYVNEAESAHLENMFWACLIQTTLGIAINLPSHSLQINLQIPMQHHWHLNVMVEKVRIQSWTHQFCLKIKLVLKSNTSAIKILGHFISKYLCSLHAAHRGGSHVVLKPDETSAQRGSSALHQI